MLVSLLFQQLRDLTGIIVSPFPGYGRLRLTEGNIDQIFRVRHREVSTEVSNLFVSSILYIGCHIYAKSITFHSFPYPYRPAKIGRAIVQHPFHHPYTISISHLWVYYLHFTFVQTWGNHFSAIEKCIVECHHLHRCNLLPTTDGIPSERGLRPARNNSRGFHSNHSIDAVRLAVRHSLKSLVKSLPGIAKRFLRG